MSDPTTPSAVPSGVALYAAVGAELTQYRVDVAAAALTRCGTVRLPANVQYAWPHVSRRYLYVASSNSAPGVGPVGDRHHITAFAIDPVSGALTQHGDPIPLPTRPIHMTTDIPSEHILVAFNNPGAIRVYRINADGTPGAEVAQPGPIDPGIYPHQARVSLDNRRAILVARGHDAGAGRAEEPGALKVFDFRDGLLTNETSIAPNGGYGFGPRHLDFHPTRPWIFVSLERQNRLEMFEAEDGSPASAARFSKDLLSCPVPAGVRQLAGTVHVHPNGRFVYGVNRASATVAVDGKTVFAGGENTLAAYAIDQATGEPGLIQHVDTGGIHCRTFHIDPSGRLLVAAHIMGLAVRDGANVRAVPARLSVFRIGPDGELAFVRAYDCDVGNAMLFWMGMVAL